MQHCCMAGPGVRGAAWWCRRRTASVEVKAEPREAKRGAKQEVKAEPSESPSTQAYFLLNCTCVHTVYNNYTSSDLYGFRPIRMC